MTQTFDLIVIGGGPAGFFAAIRFAALVSANHAPRVDPPRVLILEKSEQVLGKLLLSGGGRCNLTHDTSDPAELIRFYPRGRKALRNTFYRFGPPQTVQWFAERGLRCYTDEIGCVFPLSNSSQSLADVLTGEAERLGVRVWTQAGAQGLAQDETTRRWQVRISNGSEVSAPLLLIAAGGSRAMLKGLRAIGVTVEDPIPSLFAFRLAETEFIPLAGIVVEDTQTSLPGTRLKQRGALLFTHRGISGPAVINLSAWAARELHQSQYQRPISIDFLPAHGSPDTTDSQLLAQKQQASTRQVNSRSPFEALPARLWEVLCARAGLPETLRWADMSKAQLAKLRTELRACLVHLTARDTHQQEYVTCGGVALHGIDLQTFESKTRPGLFFAGEVLDVDGLTGGYNLQNCWSTGWAAGTSMAQCYLLTKGENHE